jgi:hypothetical protein
MRLTPMSIPIDPRIRLDHRGGVSTHSDISEAFKAFVETQGVILEPQEDVVQDRDIPGETAFTWNLYDSPCTPERLRELAEQWTRERRAEERNEIAEGS